MQTVSSASRTCMASASAVEWTATVLIPISWQARWTRSAISPRLAIRTLLNGIGSTRLLEDQQRLIILNGLGVLDKDLLDGPAARRSDRVHHLHRLDDQQGIARLDTRTGRNERLSARLGREKGGADHRRLDCSRM